jgi:hypothetical protein
MALSLLSIFCLLTFVAVAGAGGRRVLSPVVVSSAERLRQRDRSAERHPVRAVLGVEC